MYKCLKYLVKKKKKKKEYSCLDHSDFLTHIQCLHLMYAELAWVLVSAGTQV